ncbi:MAG: methyltransferase domain-containing protein [Pseudonocardiales bacterium]
MDWTQQLAALADQLSAAGKLTCPAWRAAYCAVPRHELVPQIYTLDENRRWCPLAPGSQAWWELVYSDTTVITRVLPGSRGIPGPVSSSTKPGLMLRMLEALDIDDGMRVLEIGTGSGYNAAVLCARLGAQQVYSVDLRPELVELARERLARLGYQPTLVARDGVEGLAEYGPFDRIIVTCGMPFIPTTWITQLTPGGLLLVDLEGPLSAGNLISLSREDTAQGRDGAAPRLRGRFLPWLGRFMPMRRDPTAADYHLTAPDRDLTAFVDTGLTSVDPIQLDGEFRFLAQLHLPSGTFHTLTACAQQPHPTHTRLVSPDGSWCEVAREPATDGRYTVRQAGIQRLWGVVEAAHHQWRELGEPDWSRFGVTATRTDQHMWLDDPDHTLHRWPLWTHGPDCQILPKKAAES